MLENHWQRKAWVQSLNRYFMLSHDVFPLAGHDHDMLICRLRFATPKCASNEKC